MSATRLLVLGLIRAYGRAHGYLIHNDLSSWKADEWANVKWGSIYHALKQMTKEGSLRCHELNEWPWRVDYEITEKGDQEFFRLLKDALRKPKQRPDMLAAGLAFMNALSRAEAISLLKERLEALELEYEKVEGWLRSSADEDSGDVPLHIIELDRLFLHSANSAAEWTRGLIERLERGAYAMADDSEDDGCCRNPSPS